MHIHTIVKVKAKSEEEAMEKVTNMLTNYGSYNFSNGFDYIDEEYTKVLKDFTEKDFLELRENEISEYKNSLEKALLLNDDNHMKGYYLMRAGEALDIDMFWTSERQAYTDENFDDKEDGNIYYLTTDRHC